MDVFSHGLWGGVAFGRKNKKNFRTAFGIGMMPDLLAFAWPFIGRLSGAAQAQNYSHGHPDASSIPQYVYHIYSFTHSIIIFLAVFLIVWAVRKKPQWLLGAWGLHILVDIPTHSSEFFPTPFLWPLSNFHVDGINWGNPIIFIPNLILLAIAYSIWGISYWRKKRLKQN